MIDSVTDTAIAAAAFWNKTEMKKNKPMIPKYSGRDLLNKHMKSKHMEKYDVSIPRIAAVKTTLSRGYTNKRTQQPPI